MSRISDLVVSSNDGNDGRLLHLEVQIRDPIVLTYLRAFDDPERPGKAVAAMKVGVIAIQSATPSLDTQVVREGFVEMEGRFKERVEEFQEDIGETLGKYFKERDGVVPKSLDGLFGKDGTLTQTFNRYFDPQDGRLARLMENQIGPGSKFGRALDPKNKDGIIALIETKVADLVQEKLNEVLKEFSLDEDGSAMGRLAKMVADGVAGIGKAVGIKAAQAEEAEKGHVKGLDFEADLYESIAEWGRQLGDQTELVRGINGVLKQKWGDHLITLGETTGAPGLKIAIEAKDQGYKLKDAVSELQKAKKNREASSGIFVFAKGCEPAEVGNFRRIGDDFYCTADKAALAEGGPLPFLWAAYEIARVQAVAAVRKDADGQLNLDCIRQHIDALCAWVPRLGEIIAKVCTNQKNDGAIERIASEMKEDMERRTREILTMLRQNPAA